jgi:hypothetical protein
MHQPWLQKDYGNISAATHETLKIHHAQKAVIFMINLALHKYGHYTRCGASTHTGHDKKSGLTLVLLSHNMIHTHELNQVCQHLTYLGP